MSKLVGSIKSRGIGVWILCVSLILAIACCVYYVVQSNMDGCFNPFFFACMLAGTVAAAAEIVTGLEFLLPITSIFWGAAFGIILYDMLPTLSDAWNNVILVGGNLTAYLIYSVLALLTAILCVVTCFIGEPAKA